MIALAKGIRLFFDKCISREIKRYQPKNQNKTISHVCRKQCSKLEKGQRIKTDKYPFNVILGKYILRVDNLKMINEFNG